MMGYANLLVFVVYTGGGGVQSSFFFRRSGCPKHKNSPHIAFVSERGGYTHGFHTGAAISNNN